MSPVCCCHSPALICAQERCPFSVLPPQPSPRRNFKHSNLTDYLPASKFSEKTEKCVSCGVVLPAALPCTLCLQPGSWWQFLLLSPNPSALAVSLSLGQLPVPQGPPGPISSCRCSLLCSIVRQVLCKGAREEKPSLLSHSPEQNPCSQCANLALFKRIWWCIIFSNRIGHGER